MSFVLGTTLRKALLLPFFIIPALTFSLDKVTLQLRWDHQFQFAGYYVADWQGYYEEAGIEVEIKSALQGEEILSATDEVSSGRADFGIGAADILLANDKGSDLVILSSIFQESAAALFSLKETPLDSPVDVIRQTRARIKGSLIDIEVMAMLLLEGLDPEAGKQRPHKAGLDQLVNRKVDIMPGYSITAPFAFREHEIDSRTLKPSSYGVEFYGDSLFTSEKLIEENAALVKKFRDASIKGWHYAIEHPQEVALRISHELTRNEYEDVTNLEQFNLFQAEKVEEIMLYPWIPIGHNSRERWEHTNKLLHRLGVVEHSAGNNVQIFDPQRDKMLQAERIRDMFLLIIGIVVFIIFSFLIWITLLHRTVQARTKELAESERQYRRLIEHLPAVFYTFKPGYGGTFFSPQAMQLGYTVNELLEDPMLWYESIHLDDKEKVDQAITEGKAGKPIDVEYRFRHKNGNWLWLIDRTYSRTLEDGTVVFDGISLDITTLKHTEDKLKENERRFRIVSDYTVDWEYWVSPDGTMLYNSPSCENLTGHAREEINSSEDIIRLVHSDDKEKFFQHMRDEGKEENSNIEFRIITKNYEVRWVGHYCRPVYDESGKFLGTRANNRDITSHKILNKKLEEAIEEKDYLMSELNHRVKNNLLMVNSLIKLKSDSLGEEIDLSDISHQIDTIRIVHEKLYQTSVITHINFHDYVEELLSTVFSFTNRAIQVESNVDVEEISTRTTIPLGLIINEIATNAIKYGFKKDEEAVFTVSMKAKNDFYVLTLSNSGNQFPEDVDFENSDTLGLRLIKILTTQLDGTVELQKEPNPVFTIRFPIAEE